MTRLIWPFRVHAGAVVAHRSLDNHRGEPKHGRVEETVGEALAITRLKGEEQPIGYDSRELTRLYMIPGLSRGPLMLRPRHYRSLLLHSLRGAWAKLRGPR